MKKVWAYSLGRALSEQEQQELLADAGNFVRGWTAHENKLQAEVSLAENCVLLVKVDESVYGASGCSIDKLQRFVKEAEKKFGIELLNRMLVPIDVSGTYRVLNTNDIKTMLGNKALSPDSTVLNTAISNEQELLHWKQPLKNTWLNRYLTKI